VKRVSGDRHDRAALLNLRNLKPDVVIDMIAFTRQDAEELVETFRGVARRLVVPSSEDVYRAYGRLHRTEPGPPDPTPLNEDGPLREKPSIHGPVREKLAVEQAVLSQADLPATILRLPAIYGPGDHRMYDIVRPMLDGRAGVVLAEDYATWRWTHGYVENVAHAIVLAVVNDRAAGRIYNVGEPEAPRQIDRHRHVASVLGWPGEILVLPRRKLPDLPGRFEHLDWSQDWTADTDRIRRELGYREIVPYEVGLNRLVEWQRAHPDEQRAPTAEEYAQDDRIIAGWRPAGS
jgi:nucleoside-diphosphate-sugar epimerase